MTLLQTLGRRIQQHCCKPSAVEPRHCYGFSAMIPFCGTFPKDSKSTALGLLGIYIYVLSIHSILFYNVLYMSTYAHQYRYCSKICFWWTLADSGGTTPRTPRLLRNLLDLFLGTETTQQARRSVDPMLWNRCSEGDGFTLNPAKICCMALHAKTSLPKNKAYQIRIRMHLCWDGMGWTLLCPHHFCSSHATFFLSFLARLSSSSQHITSPG